ncbi:MAG: hypothetical protein EPO36_13395 [Chloroflexota bacterium]|nr:MAG: hypothetical protein EPO36_13395 [Chloroflexota bacterium]
MHAHADERLRLANDWIAREIREAARARLAYQARQRLRPSLRHRAGRQLIKLGQRLAAEPNLTLARSR